MDEFNRYVTGEPSAPKSESDGFAQNEQRSESSAAQNGFAGNTAPQQSVPPYNNPVPQQPVNPMAQSPSYVAGTVPPPQYNYTEKPLPRNDDYFGQESYYERNPLPQRMPSSPYEPPQPPKYANFVPMDLNTTKPASHRGGRILAIVVTAVVCFTLFGIYLAIDKYGSYASYTDEPEETSVTDKSSPDDKDTSDKTKSEEATTAEKKLPAETTDREVAAESKPIDDSDNYYVSGSEMLTSEGVYQTVVPSVVSIRATLDEQGNTVSAGSGIIITDTGYIVTNNHVIENYYDITVSDFNGNEYDASVVGCDSKTDLAVIKVSSSHKFTPAVLGNSDELNIGEPVYTIGNSGGVFSNTFTGGFVSGLNRTLRLTQNSIEMDYIQTDATINPGNSGGPLVNAYGQVVGINNFKYYGQNANCENMTFAIAINEAIPVINELMQSGTISGRVRIGITYTAVSEETARQKNLVAGLYIAEIAEDCDIINCDLKAGDIITEINGKKVYSSSSVQDALEGCKVGEIIEAEVYRKNDDGTIDKHTISFRLEELK